MRIPLVIIFFTAVVFCGCANRVTPTGGEKDIKPPVLLSSTPENNNTNYTSKKIVLTFDEYIQLKEPSQQLVISPPIQPAPVIEINKKSIVIVTGDSLMPNTTYTINFGNAIADNNEGNVLPDYRYVFSTGSYIDSLFVTGIIIDAQNEKPQDGALALLYDSNTNDTLILNKLPDYFGRTDVNGKFLIPNVRPGSYRIYALAEKNTNYIYDQPEELTGFSENIFILKDSTEFKIQVNKLPPQKQIIKSSTIREPGVAVTAFSKPARNLTWEIQNTKFDKVVEEYSENSDTITLYCFPPIKDTLSIVWIENAIPFDTVSYQKPRGSSKTDSQIKTTGYTIYPSKGGILNAETIPSITWWAPIEQSDFSKIIVMKDSVIFPATILFSDSLNTILNLKSEWKEGNYNITILPGAVKDVYGFSNDSITSIFTIPLEKTKGSISFKINIQETGSHLLQLVNDKHDLIRQRVFEQQATGVFEQVDPGTYMLRVISDSNKNGKWDGGDFRINISPEKIMYHPESILVRSNWEVEMEWTK